MYRGFRVVHPLVPDADGVDLEESVDNTSSAPTSSTSERISVSTAATTPPSILRRVSSKIPSTSVRTNLSCSAQRPTHTYLGEEARSILEEEHPGDLQHGGRFTIIDHLSSAVDFIPSDLDIDLEYIS
jgi:hypothetical protein